MNLYWKESKLCFSQTNALDLKYSTARSSASPSFTHSSEHIHPSCNRWWTSIPTNTLFHMSWVLFCSSGGLPKHCLPQTQHPATMCSSDFVPQFNSPGNHVLSLRIMRDFSFYYLLLVITDNVLLLYGTNKYCVLKSYFSWMKRQICTWSDIIFCVFRQIDVEWFMKMTETGGFAIETDEIVWILWQIFPPFLKIHTWF